MIRISTGSESFDQFLEGGYESDIITTIYGPSGSGKTNLCLLAAITMVNNGKKVVYVDTEGNISVERLKQLSENSTKVLENCLFLRPTSFEEQKNSFEQLKKVIDDKIGLIVVDTVSMLYRVERGQSYDPYEIDSDLSTQISALTEIARKHNIPILITNQVYDNFNGNGVKMVGGNLLAYSSKCLIELKKAHNNKRVAILKKHRSISEEKELSFEIVHSGIKKLALKP
tara:strand:- start:588 stop:1271 length:684 start_codon:yes stop_codon:yes gene_type:complete